MIITHVEDSFIPKLVAEVDKAADHARQIVVGDPVRVKEYERAQAHAEVYKAAGYTGDVPSAVQAWADAKASSGWTARDAADDILAAAARWLGALDAIRALRLKAKEDIKLSTSAADAENVYESFKVSLATLMQGV